MISLSNKETIRFYSSTLTILSEHYILYNNIHPNEERKIEKIEDEIEAYEKKINRIFLAIKNEKSLPIMIMPENVNDSYKKLCKIIYLIFSSNFMDYLNGDFKYMKFNIGYSDISDIIDNPIEDLEELFIFRNAQKFILPTYLAVIANKKYTSVRGMKTNNLIFLDDKRFNWDSNKGVLPYYIDYSYIL